MMQKLKERFHHFQPKIQIDQVVAIIFKNVQNQPLSTLFLQRYYNRKDPYSGHLCFPGGFRQKGETLIETAIRQTEEETGINLKKDGKYFGMLDQIPFTRIGRSKSQGSSPKMLYLGIYLFEINEAVEIRLNPSEIRDYRWIPFQSFFTPKHKMSYNQKKYYFKVPDGADSNIRKIKYVCFPSIDIGMDSDLWGLTLLCMFYTVLQIAKMENISFPNNKVDVEHLRSMLFHCINLKAFNFDGTIQLSHLNPFRRAFIFGKLSKL